MGQFRRLLARLPRIVRTNRQSTIEQSAIANRQSPNRQSSIANSVNRQSPIVNRQSEVFVGWRGERTGRLLHQIRFDEPIEVAVEDAVDVPHLLLRAVVLHYLIRVQDVAADLAAER